MSRFFKSKKVPVPAVLAKPGLGRVSLIFAYAPNANLSRPVLILTLLLPSLHPPLVLFLNLLVRNDDAGRLDAGRLYSLMVRCAIRLCSRGS